MRHFLVLEMRHEAGLDPELAYVNITCYGAGEVADNVPLIDIEQIRSVPKFDASLVKALIKNRDIITKSSRTLYKALSLYIPDINTNHTYCKKIIGITRAYTPKGSMGVRSFMDIVKQFGLDFKGVEALLRETKQQVNSQPIVDSVCFDLLILKKDLCQKYALWQNEYEKPTRRR